MSVDFDQRVRSPIGSSAPCVDCGTRSCAAHIVPDRDPLGEPTVSNGLSLCKLHHAAFDRHFIGIRPDYVVEVRGDVLEEEDGPMLLHGLKGMHRTRIQLPRKAIERPDAALLKRRYAEFRSVA